MNTEQKTAQLDFTGRFTIIRFPYDPNLVAEIRKLEGRKSVKDLNKKHKFWSAWASLNNLRRLRELGFKLDSGCRHILLPVSVEDDTNPLTLPGFTGKLRPYQETGVRFIEAKNGRAIEADEMRLGKTITSIAWLHLREDALPALVICPNNVKLNWKREFDKFSERIRAQIIEGTRPNHIWAGAAIINYEILSDTEKCPLCKGKKKVGGKKCPNCAGAGILVRVREDIASVKWRTIIVDECQRIKHPTSQRAKAVRILASNTPYFIPMSGTPIEKKQSEFFNLLNMLDPVNFNSWHRYMTEYAGAKMTRWGWDTSRNTNTEKLNSVLKHFMVRRLKRDVLPDLPEKSYSVVPMEVRNRAEYDKADTDFTEWVRTNFGKAKADKAARSEAIVKINYLKKLASKGKFSSALEWIEDTLEGVDKLVVFAYFRETVEQLRDKLEKYNPVIIYGGTTPKQNQVAQDEFLHNPDKRVCIGNITSAGLGIELSSAHNFVFLEYDWNPSAHQQAEDRGLSAAQKSKEYNIWYLTASDTIEEDMLAILDKKQAVIDGVLDGKEVNEESMLSQLLHKRLGG